MGIDYPHKQVKMAFFLKMQGESVWNTVESEWLPLVSVEKNGFFSQAMEVQS